MDATPEIEPHAHHRTGHKRLDMILAVCALLVSLVSVVLGIENAIAMRQLVAASSWPYVNVGVSNGNAEGGAALNLLVQNKGVGPAKVKSLEVFYDGKPMEGEEALMRTLTGGKPVPIVRSRVVGSVLSADETVHFLSVPTHSVPEGDLLQMAKLSEKITIRTCYCSAFDECWVTDRTVKPATSAEVDECPAVAVPFQG